MSKNKQGADAPFALPLRIDLPENNDSAFIVAADNELVLKSESHTEAELSYIVRACNAHGALVKALERLTEFAEGMAESGFMESLRDDLEASSAALKLAKGD